MVLWCKKKKRSAFGLIGVYNMLPAEVVAANSVRDFQSALQQMLDRSCGCAARLVFLVFPSRAVVQAPLEVLVNLALGSLSWLFGLDSADS